MRNQGNAALWSGVIGGASTMMGGYTQAKTDGGWFGGR